MVPSRKGAIFVVVKPELAFEIFVGTLGAPALLDDSHDVLLTHSPRKRRDHEVGRFGFSLRPFDQKPERLPIRRRGPVVLRHLDATEAESASFLLFPPAT